MDSAAIARAGEQLGRAVGIADTVAGTDVPRLFGRGRTLDAARASLREASDLVARARHQIGTDSDAELTSPLDDALTGFASVLDDARVQRNPVEAASTSAAQDARSGVRALSSALTEAGTAGREHALPGYVAKLVDAPSAIGMVQPFALAKLFATASDFDNPVAARFVQALDAEHPETTQAARFALAGDIEHAYDTALNAYGRYTADNPPPASTDVDLLRDIVSERHGSPQQAVQSALATAPSGASAHSLAALGSLVPDDVFGVTAGTQWAQRLHDALASATDGNASSLVDTVRALRSTRSARRAIRSEFEDVLRTASEGAPQGRFASISDFASLPQSLQPTRLDTALNTDVAGLRGMVMDADVTRATRERRTKIDYTRELLAIARKPLHEISADEFRRSAVIASLPRNVRPDLPAPLDARYTVVQNYRNQWRDDDTAKEFANVAFHLDVQLMAADETGSQEQYASTLLAIARKPLAEISEDEFRRSAVIASLPVGLRPDLPAPVDARYTLVTNYQHKWRDDDTAQEFANVAAHLTWTVGDADTLLASAGEALRQTTTQDPDVARTTIRGVRGVLLQLPVVEGSAQSAVRDAAVGHLDRVLGRIDRTIPQGYGNYPDMSDVGQAAENADLLHKLRTLGDATDTTPEDGVTW